MLDADALTSFDKARPVWLEAESYKIGNRSCPTGVWDALKGATRVRIEAPLEGLPGDDPEEDTRKYVAALEAQIRRCPEQYYWVHRKFKNRPESLPDVYADLDALK